MSETRRIDPQLSLTLGIGIGWNVSTTFSGYLRATHTMNNLNHVM